MERENFVEIEFHFCGLNQLPWHRKGSLLAYFSLLMVSSKVTSNWPTNLPLLVKLDDWMVF
jgi:hypothetical protein